MAIQLSDNINLIAPKSLDNRYGPWNSVNDANTNISSIQRTRGLTVGVFSGSGVVEYWYFSGITNNDLILKTSTSTQSNNLIGDYLPLSGGTVTGGTIFQSGLTANTIFATTISGGTLYGDGSNLTNVNNIYNNNGTLQSDRVVDLNSYTLNFSSSTNPNTLVLSGGSVGIGTLTPLFPLHIVTSSSTMQYRTDVAGAALLVSGNTDIPRLDAFGNGNFSVSIGVVASGATESDWATRGKPTDSFLRASVFSNGLNIINASPGIGTTEDYIRFYAGKNANQGQSDIHVQGSGSTRGFVGIGIDNPTAKLHVNNTGTTNLFLVEDSQNPDSSPFVIDASGNTGIGTLTPLYKLDVSGTTGRIFFDVDTNRSPLRQSQVYVSGPETGITSVSLFSNPFQGIELFSIGTGVTNNVNFRLFGDPGDVALYATSSARNLNIINNTGTGTTDNIRFYAGGLGVLSARTSDIHIQGSGSTRGFVGIGIDNPTNKLHVSASTDPVRFEGLQSGNTNTRILTSDSNGVIRYTEIASLTAITSADTYTTGGTYINSTSTLNLFDSSGNTITITGFTKYFITGSTPSGVINYGDRWYNTDNGIELVYINDGNSDQWVQPANTPGPPGYSNLMITTGVTTSALTLNINTNYYGVNYAGNVNLTLPNPSGNDGYNIHIKDESGNASIYRIRVNSVFGLIDGNTYVDMNSNYMSLHFVARNNNWWII